MGIRWANDPKSWRVHKPSFGRLPMLGSSCGCSDRKAKNHWDLHLTVAHVMHLCSLIDDLIHSTEHKIAILHFCNGTHFSHRCPHGCADNCRLGDRRVHDAFMPEVIGESQRHCEPAAESSRDAYVLAENEYRRVTSHCQTHGISKCFNHGHL